MAIIPVRDLAKLGVISDAESWNLPIECFSMAINARFEDGSVTRGPVFRNAGNTSGPIRHMFNFEDTGGINHMLTVNNVGSLIEWKDGTETNRSPAGYSGTDSDALVTSCEVADVIYINREDRSPWYRLRNSNANFADLSTYNSGNGLTQLASNIRFKSLRSVAGGMLVGINVTKGAQSFPTMVKWSDFVTYGTPPKSWELDGTKLGSTDNQASSAGENTLSEMKGYLIDGCALGNDMILYGNRETWLMQYVGGNDIFDFRRLFDAGVINTNCVVEHENRHYVFGFDDIYITEGLSKKSLAAGRTRRLIYGSLVSSMRHLCFTVHNPILTEIMFCYVSADKYCKYPYGAPYNNKGCNRAAVYNYVNDTWTFYDLPYLCAADFGSVTTGLTWAALRDSSTTWTDVGGAWIAQGDDARKILLMGGYGFTHSDGSTQPTRIRSFELFTGENAPSDIDRPATAPVFLEKSRMDLDELQANLEGMKLIQSIVPEAMLSPDALPLVFTVGATDNPSIEPTFDAPQSFDRENYKLYYDLAGRYLTIKIEHNDFHHFSLSGFDFEVIPLGN